MNEKTIGMTLLRVGIAFIIIKDLIIYLFLLDYLFGPHAIVPFSMYDYIMHQYRITFLEINFNDLHQAFFYMSASLVCAVLFLLGWRTFWTGMLLFLFLTILKMRNIFILDGGDNLIQILLPFIAISNSLPLYTTSAKSAVDSRWKQTQLLVSRLGNYGVMIEVCYVYLFAFLHKLPGPLWLDGTATYYVMRTAEFQGTPFNVWITQSALFVKFTTYATLVWEGLFPLLIWVKGKVKYYLLAFSILMHVGILVFMRIDNYSLVMLVSYFAFLTNEEYVKLRRILSEKLPLSMLGQMTQREKVR
jgi:hypothetical protein